MSYYPDSPGFKSTGTSEIAANTTDAEALRAVTLASIKRAPKTADEVATDVGIDRLAIRPRCTELQLAGLIRKSGVCRPNVSGKMATVWEVVPTVPTPTLPARAGMLFDTRKDAASL